MTENERKEQFVLHGTVAVVEGSGNGFQITHVLTDERDPATVYLSLVAYDQKNDFTDARTVALPNEHAHTLGNQLLSAQARQRPEQA